jgi:hypothetical protein
VRILRPCPGSSGRTAARVREEVKLLVDELPTKINLFRPRDPPLAQRLDERVLHHELTAS